MTKKYIIFIVFLITSNIAAQEGPPIGIQNAGNTCFMNSALQCLYHSKDLTEFLMGLPVDYYKNDTSSRAYSNFLKIYQDHVKRNEVVESEIAKINWCVKLTQLMPLSAEEKKSGQTTKKFGDTQDASELTVQLLQHLIVNDVYPKYFNVIPKYGFPLNALPRNRLTDLLVTIILELKQPFNTAKNLPIGNPLMGSSEQYMLPISIVKGLPEETLPTKDTVKIFDSLNSALANTFNKPQFSPSQARNPFFELRKILKLPEILIISLDRFTYLADSNEDRNKIYNRIPFPVTDLSFKNYLANPSSQQAEYDLYGIVMHHYEGAHYTAYVKVGNQWYQCDDFHVQKVEESVINGRDGIATSESASDKIEIRSDIDSLTPHDSSRYITPYMLFYKQKPGKRIDFSKKNIITTKDLENRLLDTIPAGYLPLPYLQMYQAHYKVTLDSIAKGINEGLVNLDYITNVFLGWLEDKEKSERLNVLRNFSSSLLTLSLRL